VSVTPDIIRGSISHLYSTLDIIDSNLSNNGSDKFSMLVEKANLSSVVGNIIGAGCEKYSNNRYYRNAPNTYPDLLPRNNNDHGIEIKTAIGRNAPKGHHIKSGYYLIFRYCLTGENGILSDKENQNTVTIWEVKEGFLEEDDFTYSDTRFDSGKTATIKLSSLDNLKLLYFDQMACPYKHHSLDTPYSGFN
jgi:hypothetical protein